MQRLGAYPKRECPRCRRRIAINRDGQQRAHYCLHFRSCEAGQCEECAQRSDETTRMSGDRGESCTNPPPAA